ncbi:acetyl-CoA carboxylase biotin carboxyl carrier protein subunit [Pararhodobacter zhoushanensis]|mgnify:CR=1 FL=1|jgi:acetyl-CoA carboxylase biotin carboxyl carrier protein|uniref:acetyl-CoA carboxylase biotin carboxyl carrier protein subunit n=1 Tax=Pararhodobacter zhoushanensis TaxID=2479545 RepID=UPI000F8F82B6|nr:acetyl-CoA carboxylase biotin carboxyl carrier protein subunit [Pararhodobacter zhoushanensis]
MTKTIDIVANITGVVWTVDVEVGQRLDEDDPVVTLESMKMEIPVGAPCSGEIVEILVSKDDPVAEGQTVARLRP